MDRAISFLFLIRVNIDDQVDSGTRKTRSEPDRESRGNKLPLTYAMHYTAVSIHYSSELYRYKIKAADHFLSFAEVVNAWGQEQSFREFYTNLLTELPFSAVYWEHPPVTTTTIESLDYEFSVRPASRLATFKADPSRYQAYFTTAPIVSFLSLGKDCQLVVPGPHDMTTNYTHLLTFLRTASAEQKAAFWQAISQHLQGRLSAAPLYLSTHGMGVPWLHVRLDERPKYYSNHMYRR